MQHAALRWQCFIEQLHSHMYSLVKGTQKAVCRFCSLDKTSGVTVEFSEHDAFQRGVQARSFRNELIFMQPSFQSHAARNMAVNSLLLLRRLGFAHWLLLMHNKAWCEEASAIFDGDSGCVHFDPHVEPYSRLYASIKKAPMARATWFFRCLPDSDTVVLVRRYGVQCTLQAKQNRDQCWVSGTS